MKQIYNEGRVVGLSAYESYIRQLLSTNPNATPLSEREWLSVSLSTNCSMIMRVPAGTTKGYHDFVLPEGTDLCGCSVIYGTVFEGDVTMFDDGCWARMVDSYGKLIVNTPDLHPVTPGTGPYIPTEPDPGDMSNTFVQRCKDFIKITSAMMFQPGEWETNVYFTQLLTQDEDEILTQQGEELLAPQTDTVCYGTVIPDLSERGFIRLAISEDIVGDVYIYLHGFAYKALVKGEIGYKIEEFSYRPQDGDFLGPSIFPWGCPVYLLTTSSVQWVIYNELRSR